jgi:hypothetical protein
MSLTGLDATEKAGTGAALNRCRALEPSVECSELFLSVRAPPPFSPATGAAPVHQPVRFSLSFLITRYA